jgi:hypothetical protein
MSVANGQFRNPEKGEHTPLEAVTRRLVKTGNETTGPSMIVNYKV